MKVSENLRFSDVFRAYRSGTLVENGLTNLGKIKVVTQKRRKSRCLKIFPKFLSEHLRKSPFY